MIKQLLTILLEWLYSFGEGIMNLANKLLLALSQSGSGLSAADAYAAKVLTYSPDIYFKLNEVSGTTAINYGSISSADGTYSANDIAGAATGPFSGAAPLLVRADVDSVDINTVALAAAYTQNNVSFGIWYQYGGTWSDSSNAEIFKFFADSNNYGFAQKFGVNTIRVALNHGATLTVLTVNVNTIGANDANWHHLGITLNTAGNTSILYIDGVSRDTDVCPTYTGSGIAVNSGVLGADVAAASTRSWPGSLDHFVYKTSVLDGTAMADLAS